MLPNEHRENRILLMYGVYTQGSQAAIESVTNAERLAELRNKGVLTEDEFQSQKRKILGG